jgi:hypothetical protein
MDSFQIFGIQFLLSLILYALIAAWYVAPRLATLGLHDALIPLFFLHAFRYLGMVFLVSAVVAPTLTPAFARPAAYGDLLAGLLALATIVALRARWSAAIPLAWIANVVGTLDLLNAFYQGISRNVGPHLGSAWYIPTFVVPALYVTHFMIFVMLIRRSR